MLRIGEWRVDPRSGEIAREGESARLDLRATRLLMCLAERAGEVVSIDDLLNHVWPGVIVSPDSVYQAVASLRRQLGDDHKQPAYIETVPRLGYRMVAVVSPLPDESRSLRPIAVQGNQDRATAELGTVANAREAEQMKDLSSALRDSRVSRSVWMYLLSGGAIVALALVAFLIYGRMGSSRRLAAGVTAPLPQKSLAVLPFLDLTEGMKEEEFADGMTEELIDKLSKIPDFRVPPPTSSFYYKGKQVELADVAKALGVTYLLDGSVRKSGGRVRIAARLVRADNGYVIWSETYDRPWEDVILIQDDIAGDVTNSLRASIEGEPRVGSSK
jgi:TolB-like protein/DNA-binding winged helix-turn-helix (wHTH) protein